VSNIHVDPEKLRDFARVLKGYAALVEGSLAEVDGSLRRLGQTWCDQDFEVFASGVRQTRQRLATFSVDAQKAASMIDQDADSIERFRKVRLPE